MAIARTLLLLGGLASATRAQFTPIAVPSTFGYTERLMFGDLDGDGDLDVVLANGGDFGNDVNRVWINLGGLQGGTIGSFADETPTRWTGILDDSRDVELVDIDADGDLDAYIANTSTVSAQGNRWVVNMGGAQGGTAGYFQDQTIARWVGLGQGPGPGHPYASSVAPGLLAGLSILGGFKDWSCECGFGDVDNDGDMDLLHASYGNAFNGNAPTRIFLNDGAGFFSEFNPSGFQLSGDSIANGNPGLWCEGTQLNGTTDITGTNCDIATHQLAAMFADLDNDLDLDIFLGSRNTQPRAYFNRLQETGSLLWRDMTAFVYMASAVGANNYEQNLADLDNDFDLDAYLLDYGTAADSLTDLVAFNNGAGKLVNFTTLPASSGSDNEPDFIDIDNDGDMDLVVSAFNLADRIYVNGPPIGTFSVLPGLPPVPGITLDVDVADWDNDGDYDAAWAVDQGGNEVFLRNDTTSNDLTPPALKRLEAATDRVAGAAPTVVRVQVYDNSPLYQAGRDATSLKVAVNGCPMPDRPMRYSGGQIFRGTIPGWYAGTISYSAVSVDEHGNVGSSTTLAGAPDAKVYVASGSTNTLPYGPGTAGTGGLVPGLFANGPAVGGNLDFALAVVQGLPSGAGFLILALGSQVPPIQILGANVNVAFVPLFFPLPAALDAAGRAAIVLPVPAGTPAGSVFAQFFGLDPGAAGGFSASAGLQIDF
jgi:VCBS repeat protein